MQGFNMGRYHAPSSLDPSLSTTRAPKNPHPLGSRARKLPLGILTIRFEMPFAIWCLTCPSHSPSALIGQGVRFNAEKKRVGSYLSTPIWSFRMKHTACGGWLEIRTDPKNTEYVVTEGARKRDIGDDLKVAVREGGVLVGGKGEEEERERRRADAFAALEGRVEEKVRVKGDAARIEELRSLRERDWRDVDSAGKRARDMFRVGRKARERDTAAGERLQEKMSLGIEMLEETEEDRTRAGFVEFGQDDARGLRALEDGLLATRKPLFFAAATVASSQKFRAGSSGMDARKEMLRLELAGNTRAAIDPFSVRQPAKSGTGPAIPGIKRKRQHEVAEPEDVLGGADIVGDGARESGAEDSYDEGEEAPVGNGRSADTGRAQLALVAYDSDD